MATQPLCREDIPLYVHSEGSGLSPISSISPIATVVSIAPQPPIVLPCESTSTIQSPSSQPCPTSSTGRTSPDQTSRTKSSAVKASAASPTKTSMTRTSTTKASTTKASATKASATNTTKVSATNTTKVSTSKTSATKASATKATTDKTSATKASLTKTSGPKTVAKTATRRHGVTKSLPIVEFPTPDHVRSIPVQPMSLGNSWDDSPLSRDRVVSQLASCRQMLSALQAESQALNETLDSLMTIAQQMEVLKESFHSTARSVEALEHRSLAKSQAAVPQNATRKTTTARTGTRTTVPKSHPIEPIDPTQFSNPAQPTTEKLIATRIESIKETEQQAIQQPIQESVNYWGSSSQAPVKPTFKRTRTLQLPNLPSPQAPSSDHDDPVSSTENLIPSSQVHPSTAVVVKPSFHSSHLRSLKEHSSVESLTPQPMEYYAGYTHPPIATVKPSFRSSIRSNPQNANPQNGSPSGTQVHKEPDRIPQPIAAATHKNIAQSITNPIAQQISQTTLKEIPPTIPQTIPQQITKPIAKPIAIAPTPTEGPIVRLQSAQLQQPTRPQQIRLQTDRHRYTLAYLYQLFLQQLQTVLPIPQGERAIVFDALCWTLSAIGIRMSCQLLTHLIPMLSLPLNLALLCPALLATYLAFCVPKSSSVIVYRCLLLTLGFFIGGKL